MTSTSAMFDFSNEGDSILANDDLKPKDEVELSCQKMDLLFRDIEIPEDQLNHLEKESRFKKPKIMPFIKIVDLNKQKDDSDIELKPKSIIFIGINGEF